MSKFTWYLTVLFIACFAFCAGQEIFLRDNLRRAQKGDFIVTVQNKSYTILHIYDRTPNTLTIEEITVPAQRMHGNFTSWKDWIKNRAPGNTSWVMYSLDLSSGQMTKYYSLTKKAWYDMSKAGNFLTRLLNLRLEPVPYENRRRIGLPSLFESEDRRSLWQPRMVVDGQEIPGVAFEAWQTRWPKDNTDLSGKSIEVYVPRENDKYPSYFPYWLQISGMIGSAKIRIVDSGTRMDSPAPLCLRISRFCFPQVSDFATTREKEVTEDLIPKHSETVISYMLF